MRILCTGGAGHIGSQLIRSLPHSELTVLDNFATQRFASLFYLHRPVRLIEGDILDDSALSAAIQDQDVVVHLAALTDAEGSVKNPEPYYRVNCEGTARVAKACAKRKIPLIYPSTTSVYGPQAFQVDEMHPPGNCRRHSPYAETKYFGEEVVQSLKKKLQFVIFRIGTIYGPSPGWRNHTAVNRFCWQAAHKQPLTVWRGALDERRAYCDLTDAVRAIKWVIEQQHFPNQVYNLVTGNHTVREVVETIREWIPDIVVTEVDSPLLSQHSYAVSSVKIEQAGFVFCGGLRSGVLETLHMLGAAHVDLLASWEVSHAEERELVLQ